MMENSIKEQLIQRFVRYAKVDTQVMPEYVGQRCPTNPGQLELSRMLVDEIQALGVSCYHNDQGFVIAHLPANTAGIAPIAFMAHLDVSDDVPATGVKPQVHHNYQGQVLTLNHQISLDPAIEPYLADCQGDTIITSDGTTLLGADDKAGIAIIMQALTYLVQHPDTVHGDIEIVFTPDEEGGDGMSSFPYDQLKSKICYTFDGGHMGHIEYECYYAYTSRIQFVGVPVHPGSARGIMVNALSMLGAFIQLLPRNESPEATDGYYGCYWPTHSSGTTEKAMLEVAVRDHDLQQVQRRLQALDQFAIAVQAAFPKGHVAIEHIPSYINMRSVIEDNGVAMPRLLKAMEQVNIIPYTQPIRGGTDGARLASKGIACPNIFTGAHHLHSYSEWLSVDTMYQSYLVAIALAGIKGEINNE